MAIPPTSINRGASTAANSAANAANKPAANNRSDSSNLNASQQAILKAQLDVNLQTASKSQSLVFQAAVTAINESLASVLGPDAIETAAKEEVDVSPEATAERIVSGATGSFDRFQERYEDMDLEQQVNRFVEIIRQGVDRGFEEARDVLRSLEVLSGDIETDVAATYDLVQEGLDAFRVSRSIET